MASVLARREIGLLALINLHVFVINTLLLSMMPRWLVGLSLINALIQQVLLSQVILIDLPVIGLSRFRVVSGLLISLPLLLDLLLLLIILAHNAHLLLIGLFLVLHDGVAIMLPVPPMMIFSRLLLSHLLLNIV